MQPSHHPSYETLLDYATGNLPLAPSIIVAVHCSICKECRDTLNTIDIAGAALMEELNAEELEFNSLDHVLSKLDNNFDNSNFLIVGKTIPENFTPPTDNALPFPSSPSHPK